MKREFKFKVVCGMVTMAAMLSSWGSTYDDYVQLQVDDTTSMSSFFDNANSHWQKKNAQGEFEVVDRGPHAGERYYVPASRILATSNVTATAGSPITYTFGGDELVVKNRLYIILKRSSTTVDDAFVHVGNLVFLAGGHIYNANERAAGLSGTCTVKGTSANPSYWWNYAKAGRPILRSKMIGDSNAVFYFKNQDAASYGARTIFQYDGDATEFFGTMRLKGSCSRLNVTTPGGFSFPGTIDISNDAIFSVQAGDTATIGNLLSDGGGIILDVHNGNSAYASLVVTNRIETNGKPMSLSYPRTFQAAAESCPLVTFAAGASGTLSADDFVLTNCTLNSSIGLKDNMSLKDYPKAFWPNFVLAVTNGSDGSRTLSISHRKIVCQDASDGNEAGSLFLDGNPSHWSDDSLISPENDYYINAGFGSYAPGGTASFAGRSLTLCGAGRLYFRNPTTLTVPDFRWVAVDATSVHIQNWNGASTVSGKVTVVDVPNGIFSVQMWNGGNSKYVFTIAAELLGSGTLGLISLPSAANDARAFYALTGLNTNYAGRIHLFHTAFSGAGAATYNADPDTYCVTLTVADSRNLGGARPSFDAQAFKLATHSLLKTVGSLTFDEPTRGWYIEDVGRIRVESGETVAITNTQITYAGEFRKEGAGTLKLGGTARFTADALETPLEGTNVLAIAGGAFMPTDATCCDGLAVKFAAGTKLLLDAGAEGDLKAYGLYDVKWDSPISVAGDAALPVAFVLPEGFNKKASHRFGICTVSPAAAASMDVDDFAVASIKGMKVKVSKVENRDGSDNVVSVTFACDLIPSGFILMIR